jgi:hypothetical protein
MTKVAYEVMPDGDQWLVMRDGQPGMSYVSQEAAYEVACSEAAGDLRTGNEVRIEVVGKPIVVDVTGLSQLPEPQNRSSRTFGPFCLSRIPA